MPTLLDYQSHPNWAKLTPEQKVKLADITFDETYATHPNWQQMDEAQRQTVRQNYYKQNNIELPNPFTQAVGSFFQSAGNKLAEQASFGIANTEEGDSLIGNVAGVLAGAGANALTGAAIGSVIPGIGTSIGTTAGFVLGGFGQSLRETQNAGKTFAELGAGDYARAIIEGGVNAIPVAGVGSKAVTKLATGALIDAGINAGASVAGQAVQKGEVDLAEVAQQAGFGAGGHVAGSIINNVVSKRLARQEAQAQAQQALQGVDASQVGVLPQDGTPNVRTDLTDVFPYQEDAPFDVQGFNQDRTAQIQADLQAKVQEAVALKAQGGHNQAKLIRTSLSKEMNTLAKNGDPLASTYAQALDEIDNQAKALKQKKNAPLDEAPLVPEESFDPNTTQIGETRIDPTTGETVYYGGEITNDLDAPDPFLIEELQRREQTNALEPIGTPVKPKLLKGDMNNVTLDDISSVVKEQMVAGSNVAEGYATDVLKSLGFKVDRLKYNAKGAESRAGINHRVKIGGKTVLFKGQDTFTDIANRFSREHKIDVYNSVAKRIKKQGDLDLLNEWAMTNDNDLDPRYAEGQGQAGGAIQALQQKLSNNELAEMDFTQNKEFAIQEAKVQELLNDLDKAHTPQQVAEIESRYQEVLNTSIEPQYIQDFVAPKLEETQALVEGFQPLNRAKQERLKARLERDLNQAQTPEDIARVAEELYSDNTAKALVDEDSFYDSLVSKMQEAETRVNDPNRAVVGISTTENTELQNRSTDQASPAQTIDDALPPAKGGTEVANSGKGSPQARLDGKSQELGFKNIKHLMQGYRALGGDLTPAKVKKVLEAKPELQPVYDAMRKLTGSTDETGSPKYAEDIEFQQSLLEIARTPEKYLNYEDGTGRQQPLKQLIEKAPQDWNILDQVKKSPAYEFLSNTAKKRLELIDRLMRQHKTMDVEIATEGGMSGKGGATNAIDAKKRQNITPISWAIHNDQIALNAYNADGHFAKYYLDLDPRLVKDGKEASRFLSDPVESTAPEFVGTYPNVYRDAIPFLLEDVLNRKPREQGILTSQARDILDTARAFKSKLNKEQQLQIKYGANIGDIKKIQHELMKLNAPESVKKLTDAILNKTGNKKKLTANDIIAIKKTLEKEPTLKALKGMCDLFKLSTANLE